MGSPPTLQIEILPRLSGRWLLALFRFHQELLRNFPGLRLPRRATALAARFERIPGCDRARTPRAGAPNSSDHEQSPQVQGAHARAIQKDDQLTRRPGSKVDR